MSSLPYQWLFYWLLILLIRTKSYTTIGDAPWYDINIGEYDASGINGWSNSDIDYSIYHGQYQTDIDLFRFFECEYSATLNIKSSVAFDCHCQQSQNNDIYLHFDSTLLSSYNSIKNLTYFFDSNTGGNQCGGDYYGINSNLFIPSIGAYVPFKLHFKIRPEIQDGSCQMIIWNISIECIATPTPKPTQSPITTSPTKAPSFAPTPIGPTASPIFSTNAVYVSANGTDALDTECRISNPCLTIDYAYDCLNGGANSICALMLYNGNGVINIDSSEHYLNKAISIGNGDLIIRGKGLQSYLYTDLMTPSTQLTWFKCTYWKCWIGLEDLVLRSTRSSSSDKQLVVTGGGTMYIRSVLFDGGKFQQNTNNEAVYSFIGDRASVIFENCTFTHLDSMFEFKEGATGTFIDCYFVDNIITNTYYSGTQTHPTPFIYINSSAAVTFKDCLFENNVLQRYLINIENGAELSINNSIFRNNMDNISPNNPKSLIIATSGRPSIVTIINSQFTNNKYLDTLLQFKANSYVSLEISSSIFSDNAIKTDIEFEGVSNGEISMTDCQFSNSINTSYDHSVYLSGLIGSKNEIKNTIWDNYWVYYDLLSINDMFHDIYLENINIKNIIGRAISYDSSSYILNVYNVSFYNISKLSGTGTACCYNGAALYAKSKPSTIIMNSTIFEKCRAINGGAMYLSYPHYNTTLEKLTFIDNHASWGGDIYISNAMYITEMTPLNAPGPHTVIGSYASMGSSIVMILRSSSHDITVTFQDWTFINTTTNILSISASIIYLENIGANFINNVVINCQRSVISYDHYSLIYKATPKIDIIGSKFERNSYVKNIVNYIPNTVEAGTRIYIGSGTIFDGNDGGIFDLVINDTEILNNGGTSVIVQDVVIRNYDNPSSVLFSITSNGGSNCSSQGIQYGTDIMFDGITFEWNIDTQFIKTICVSIPVTNINLTNNRMPTLTISNNMETSTAMFLFGEYASSSYMGHIMAVNNEGIMIEDNMGINQYWQHTVRNHKGIYLFYNNQNNYIIYHFNVIILDTYITLSDSTLFIEYGLFTFYGNGRQIYDTWFYFENVNFINNIGTLISIKPISLDTSITTSICPIQQAGFNIITQSEFVNNTVVDSGYLFDIHGVSIWFDSSIDFKNNKCLSSTCLLLVDGWYTFNNFTVNNNNDFDTNFIKFGHDNNAQIPLYSINLCFNSLNTPSEINQYLTFINLNDPVNNERVTFLPLPCDSFITRYNTEFLYQFTNYTGITKLDYLSDASNVLNDNTVCIDIDCEIKCNGSISCFGSELFCGPGICNINCGAEYSCTNTKIFSDIDNGTSQISIICNGNLACSTSIMQIHDVDEFKLICSTEASCQELIVNISGINEFSEIYCQDYESCESITIYTNNPNTTIYLYQYSSDITIYSPFGYISDPDTNQQNLFCGDPQHYIYYGYNYQNAYQAVSAQYQLDSFGNVPCQDVIFFCNNYTNIEDNNCSMIQEYETDITSIIGAIFFQCYPTLLSSLYKNLCNGNCPNSPTQSPTTSPTTSPTSITNPPTAAPTNIPTMAPSSAPTELPTSTPSIAPSISPSIAPTGTPTLRPTIAPSLSPSTIPSNAPTKLPTAAPSFSPSAIPTNAPTLHPSNAPSISPSISPTLIPTQSPTGEPTGTPSVAPSYSPSIAPSISPTASPTRTPTEDIFDYYLPIRYIFGNLTNLIKEKISTRRRFIIPLIQRIIERGYFDPKFLKYYQFEVVIDEINQYKMEDINNDSWIFWGKQTDPLTFDGKINCQYDECVFISNIDMRRTDISSPTDAGIVETTEQCNSLSLFQEIVECNLASYFNRAGIDFSVYEPEALSSDLVICSKNCGNSKRFNYILTSILSFLGLMFLISILAFLYNKRLFPTFPGFSPVDDAQWAALLIFGVQAWDFVSDVNLAIEIWGDLNGNGISDSEEEEFTFRDANLLILIAAIGSTVSIIIPYIVNLTIAANIKKLIRKNNAAKAYFQYYAAVYVLFVVLSGGAYPALAVVSSNIFGLVVFDSGLTRFELKKLSKIKVFATIILENLPQLLCQILYAYILGYPSQTTQLAFCASLLSVTASTLSYWIERNAADTIPVQYYLSFECEQKRLNKRKEKEILPYDDIGNEADIDQIATVQTFDMNGEEINSENKKDLIEHKDDNKEDYDSKGRVKKLGITENEKDLFWKNKGLKFALSTEIGEVFGTSKNIEIGFVQITKYGVIAHIVHYIYSSDLEELEEESNVSIGPSFFIQQLYGSYLNEINQIFRSHFHVNQDFNVLFHKKYPNKDNKLINKTQSNLDNNNNINNPRRSSVMQQMMKKMKTLSVLPTMNEIKNEGIDDISMDDEEELYLNENNEIEMVDFDLNNNKNKESNIKMKLNDVLKKYKFSSNTEKKQFLMNWINDYEEEKVEENDDDDTSERFINNKNISIPL